MNEKLQEGVELLAENGLNLTAVFDCATLPVDVLEVMGVPLAGYKRLLLLGHGGRRFWRAFNEFGWHTADPVDHFSIHLTETFLRDYLGNPPYLCLYPLTEYMVPLQRLGELAGWCHPSPLGLGISPTYGLDPLFVVDMFDFETRDSMLLRRPAMQIIGVVVGKVTVAAMPGEFGLELQAGEFCLIPACLDAVELWAQPKLRLLRVEVG
jgi:hypothetical protein